MITKIKICGYRIYTEFTLIPNQKLNLIVGANEAGKSTLMEATRAAQSVAIVIDGAGESTLPHWAP